MNHPSRLSKLAVFIAVTAVIVSISATVLSLRPRVAGGRDSSSPVLDRVLARGEIRVGYLIQPPYLTKSAATGEVGGIFSDVMNEAGDRLGLDIVWSEEVNLGTISAGLDAGRYDMIAFPLWRSASRAKQMSFSTPLYFSLIGTYVRVDDPRFESGLGSINRPEIRIAAVDGELAAAIAREDFPKATVVALPNIADYSQLLLEVASNKADVTFFNQVVAGRFIRNNPGTVRELPSEPIRVFAECFILPLNDPVFASMINATVQELLENGYLHEAFRSNGENPGDYYFPDLPYRTEEAAPGGIRPATE